MRYLLATAFLFLAFGCPSVDAQSCTINVVKAPMTIGEAVDCLYLLDVSDQVDAEPDADTRQAKTNRSFLDGHTAGRLGKCKRLKSKIKTMDADPGNNLINRSLAKLMSGEFKALCYDDTSITAPLDFAACSAWITAECGRSANVIPAMPLLPGCSEARCSDGRIYSIVCPE